MRGTLRRPPVVPPPHYEDPSQLRKLLTLALLALVLGGGVAFVSIESQATALAGAPMVSSASHPPANALAAFAHRLPGRSPRT
jgi:hypothetical protein